MTVKSIKTSDTEELFNMLERMTFSNREIVFRGEGNARNRSRSTYARWSTRPPKSNELDDMLVHFLAKVRSIDRYREEFADNRRGRLEYGRHYGVPSPLIDFTKSPYIGLFFAFDRIGRKKESSDSEGREKESSDDEVVVYALDVPQLAVSWARLVTAKPEGTAEREWSGPTPGDVHDEFRWDSGRKGKMLFEERYSEDDLMFLSMPASWNRRMVRQMGVFLYDTLDYKRLGCTDLEDFLGKIKEPSDGTNPNEPRPGDPVLTKIYAPKRIAGDVLMRLELMGISGTHLYDDPAGAAVDVANTYHYDARTATVWDLSLCDKKGDTCSKPV
jgi:hypothetical protein